ncbi:hypothetical protein J6590_078930 [Homalodisca vitripennis]|nr:hypothetical protein J6590_078930 [Homalodisca vitripennis]
MSRWIRRSGPIAWQSRSPDLAPMDFFSMGFHKKMYVPPLPANLKDLRRRIPAAVAVPVGCLPYH